MTKRWSQLNKQKYMFRINSMKTEVLKFCTTDLHQNRKKQSIKSRLPRIILTRSSLVLINYYISRKSTRNNSFQIVTYYFSVIIFNPSNIKRYVNACMYSYEGLQVKLVQIFVSSLMQINNENVKVHRIPAYEGCEIAIVSIRTTRVQDLQKI